MNVNPDKKRLAELAEKWLNGTINDHEAKEFADWYNHFPDDIIEIEPAFAANRDTLKNRMYKRMQKEVGANVVQLNKNRFVFLRVAAAVIILIVSAAAYYFINSSKTENNVSIVADQSRDINAPQQLKATLTLADGKSYRTG